MTFFILTFIIAVTNLALGYALAVFLGFGPPTLADAWDALTRRPQSSEESGFEQMMETLSAQSLDDMLDDLAEDEADYQPCDMPYDDDAAELLNPDDPENWDLNEKYVETSILKLNIAMMKSGKRSTDIDTKLRSIAGRSDAETIGRCLADLKEDCEVYLQQQSEASEKFSARISELGELRALGEEIEMANLEQAAQIETTLSNLQHMDFESDLEAANGRLLEELHNLRVARHRLRDNQEAAFLAVARYEDRLETIERQLYNDPLTRLRNRIGLEVTLLEWWKQQRQQSRQLVAALLDIDLFGKVNERHGAMVGDRILAQLAGHVKSSVGQHDLVGRFTGESFLVMMVDVGPRAGTKNAEQLRQSIEKIVFRHAGGEIALTVSVGITEVKPTDSDVGVLARVAETMQQAKRGGRNCSFYHDGEKAEAVEAPNLGAKPLEINL